MQLVPKRGICENFSEREGKKIDPTTGDEPDAGLRDRRARYRAREAHDGRARGDRGLPRVPSTTPVPAAAPTAPPLTAPLPPRPSARRSPHPLRLRPR
jgi:hypothetical protein